MNKDYTVIQNGACDNCGDQKPVRTRYKKGQWQKIFLCQQCGKDKTL